MPPDHDLIRLLCVEDNPDDVELMELALERSDPERRYELHRVDDPGAFVEALQRDFDAILCDFNMPRFSPYAALQILVARRCHTPLLVVTRAIGEEAAVHVLRCGAKDYVTKDKLGTLPQIIDRVMAERHRVQEQERLGRELEAAYRRLKKLSARLVVAQERERTLISRELHDQLGQTLTGVVIHLHAAQRAAEAGDARRHADTAMDMAQGAVEQLKTLSFSLRPPQLDLLGLVATVQTAVQRFAEPAGLAFAVTARGQEPQVLGETASVAVRLVQEALNNIVRHANASQVWVRLRFLPQGRIGLLVLDDGVGFDKAALLTGQPSEHNVGLYGMIERTELAGGRLHIRTCPGAGVAIRAVL
ncbi:hybrid sensor histidine kinase/response regulator [Ramlibacter tataouinensis]|uniref:histidine kinase n=1 Tax=Ramlibacter tataouinensis (strain ATCC BAA-407 / DSM 14655 / LMG 21543 / TTB310) TaxID=365046 RepID=F5XX21_RAMTT|nr:histidine kinase [Ramlibacter tataouinensis]AEG92965.1 Candidate histidine kinase, hybrid [Ramlibacter tataouinensis TTB310]